MTRNCTVRVFDWDKKFIIQVEEEGVSIAQELIFIAIFFYASPLCSSETTNTRTVLNLDEADGRSLAITLLMEVLGSPAVSSRIENHFDRHEFSTQIIHNELDASLFFPNKWRSFKVVLRINWLECNYRVLKWKLERTIILLLLLARLKQLESEL